MGFLTIAGLAEQGFFIPYRYASQTMNTPRNAFVGVTEALDQGSAGLQEMLDCINGYADDLKLIGGQPPPEPRWQQDWFPGLDAACAYAVVRHHKPKRIVEVGCGHSTRFLARAISDGKLDTVITAIDPAPRADLKGVGVRFVEATIQHAIDADIGMQCFQELEAGDILSIDSSHILMPGTDVDILLNRILPRLPVGVMVHIHDMFLPDDYPVAWKWRGYNEQLGVAPLLEGGRYTLLWSSHYVRTRMQSLVSEGKFTRNMVVPHGAPESSLWLLKSDPND